MSISTSRSKIRASDEYSPETRGHHNNCCLSKARDVIVLVLKVDVFQKFHRPDHIKGLLGPPRSPRKVVLRQYGLVGHHALFDGVVASLHTLATQVMGYKPRSADAPATANIKNTLDRPFVHGMFPCCR